MQEQNDNEYYVLSPGRAWTEEEMSLIWTKPLTHKVSAEERRITNEIKRNWDRGEMKIANVLLEGMPDPEKRSSLKRCPQASGSPTPKSHVLPIWINRILSEPFYRLLLPIEWSTSNLPTRLP